MRIAVNTRFLLKGKLEGIGTFTFESMKQLVLQHPEHDFIFFFDRPFSPEFIFAKNITPVVLFPPARHPFLFYAWFEFAVSRALKKHKADIFISTDGFLSLRTKVKTLLVVHDIAFYHYPNQISFWEKKYYGHFMPKFLKKANRLLTVSAYTKQDVVKHYAIKPEKIDIAYNACNENFKPISLEKQQVIQGKYAQGAPYFLYIGSVHPRKNVGRLLQAFDDFKKRNENNVKLLIAGRMAWQTGSVNQIYQRLEHKKDIIFLDYLPAQTLREITAAAFALTYVSILEGFGIPILEAMTCDVPVITSNCSSMPEVAGKAAILVDPFSVASIAEGMEKLWQNPDLREELIAQGRIERTRFSWEETAKQIWNAIQRMLEED